ncbi:UNVERIFIED_CONTAM: hypothetical protein GTU68_066153, partial [Idotea baltica]|nr:hypothetical protein [Idotea baltica]
DSVYGFISLPKLVWEFIDTPHFQRLRHIKQLGCLSWVFPGAMHSRFEHSLGTGYLAQKYITTIIEKQDGIVSISDEAIFTVTLAGVLHDIGHGPYSHLFDSQVVKYIYSRDLDEVDRN